MYVEAFTHSHPLTEDRNTEKLEQEIDTLSRATPKKSDDGFE